jgi:hypothetical protein
MIYPDNKWYDTLREVGGGPWSGRAAARGSMDVVCIRYGEKHVDVP